MDNLGGVISVVMVAALVLSINFAPVPDKGTLALGLGVVALAASAVALLPVWARRQLLLPVFPVTERTVVRATGEALTRTIRWAMAPR